MGTPVSPEPARANTSGPSMDLLPDVAIPAMERAIAALIGPPLPVSIIWEAFCLDLEEIGVEPPRRITFRTWAERIRQGDFMAAQISQSNGELRQSSAQLLAEVMKTQACHLERTARQLRKSAADIAAVCATVQQTIDGRPA